MHRRADLRILVDIGHPALVHVFRNAMRIWLAKGHQVTIAARDKDIATELLDLYGFSYCTISKARRGTLGLAIELIERNWQLLKLARQCESEVLLGTSVSISHVARLMGTQALVFNDDDADAVRAFALLAYPLAHAIITPSCLDEDYGQRHVQFDGYKELAYLHPNVYTPDPGILSKLGVHPGEPHYVVRFVASQASHDRSASGLSLAMRRKLVQELSRRGRLFISSERPLLGEFEPYGFRISPKDMHDALAFATMLITDGQTMTAEAAVLGVPAIRCNTFVGRISYLEELEHKYGLTYGFLPQEEGQMFNKVVQLLDQGNLRVKWQTKREKMLADKIDLTPWLVDFVERYPQSFRDYQQQAASGGAR